MPTPPRRRSPVRFDHLPTLEELQPALAKGSRLYEMSKRQITMKRYALAARRERAGIDAIAESPCASQFSSLASSVNSVRAATPVTAAKAEEERS